MFKTFCVTCSLFCVLQMILGIKENVFFQLQSLLAKEIQDAMSPIVVTFYFWIATSWFYSLLPLICFYS